MTLYNLFSNIFQTKNIEQVKVEKGFPDFQICVVGATSECNGPEKQRKGNVMTRLSLALST